MALVAFANSFQPSHVQPPSQLELSIQRILAQIPRPKSGSRDEVKNREEDVQHHTMCLAVALLLRNSTKILFFAWHLEQSSR